MTDDRKTPGKAGTPAGAKTSAGAETPASAKTGGNAKASGDAKAAGGAPAAAAPPARAAEILPLRARRPCPICGRDSQREAYPFCSRRCKDVDLHRWLSGGYAIPAVEADADEFGGEDGLPADKGGGGEP